MHVAHKGRVYYAPDAEPLGPGSDDIPLALTVNGVGPMRDITAYFHDRIHFFDDGAHC